MNEQLTLEDIKQPEKPAEGTGRDYWDDTGQVFFTSNHGWGIAPDLSSVCLGTEFEVLAYLKGGTLPKHINQTANEVLEQIKELKESDEGGQTDRAIPAKRSYQPGARKVSSKRSRFMLDSRHRPPGARRSASTKRLPVRLSQ